MTIEAIIFYIILIDSVFCNITMWFGANWYTKHFRLLSRIFPASKGWAICYLLFVLWVGSLLLRLGAL